MFKLKSNSLGKFLGFSVIQLISIIFFLGVSGNLMASTDTLIPRKIFFKDPDRAEVRLSPDGHFLSFLAPHEGVLNVWVGDPKSPNKFRPITHNKKRGVSNYFWAYTNQHIIFVDDNDGDEDWRIYRVDVASGERLTLASFKKVQATIVAVAENKPNEILIGLNQRRSDFHDVYRLNIFTGEKELVFQNDSFVSFIADRDLNLKVAFAATADGGQEYYALNKDNSKRKLFSVSKEDFLTTSPLLLSKNAEVLYMLDSRNRDTAALMAYDLNSGKSTLIAEDPKADISDILIKPREKTIQGVASTYEKTKWKILDSALQPEMEYLKTVVNSENAEFEIISRTLEDHYWLVAYLKDNGSVQYYFYDRTGINNTTKIGKTSFLFSNLPDLDKVALTHMDPVVIQSRDKLALVSYLSLPSDIRLGTAKAKHPVPMILLVHGGPNSRDEWGYNPIHQWLANRGYAVLSVNYRGSTGFGKKFVNAGNGEWAAKMHDDLLDAVDWAVKQGITTRDKVGIMGGSYGGYATLVALTKTPEHFACGVDIVGPSNLETLLNSIPDYWRPLYANLKIKIGDGPETEKGRAFLASRSPITFVNKIQKPLLIGQGANDPRVKQAESDQIVKAMQARNIPVTYILYPDEGHGFRRPENRLSFFAVTEAFLSKTLGGRFEDIKEDFKNSSIDIKIGKENIPGI